MSIPQVGQGAVAVVPTFKGFRSTVTKETDAAAKAGGEGFTRAFASTGSRAGKQTGSGFKSAFASESTGFSSKAVSELERAVSKSASALSAARLKEQDAAGKVRLAERQLAEAREKYADDSSQVIRAEERLATAARQLGSAQDSTKASTNDLRVAQSRLAEAADRAGDELGQAGRKGASRFSSGFSDVFKGSFLGTTIAGLATDLVSNIGYAIGSGIRSAVQFGIGTISIASDLNESVNAVQVAYGDIADEIFKLGETSATTFGLSKRDLNSYAVQFSAFSKSIAGNGGDVAGTFQSILGRATDFASVMNLQVADALTLFQSGLAGETEPLRRYGIDLSAATVEQYAYANGIAASGDELTEAQKQQARYGALLAQTSAVQGDFANTSDELANKNRINAATWDDLQAKIGAGFLPIATDLARILSDDVFPVIEQLVDEYGPELGTAFQDALPALTDLAREVLPELPGLFQSVAESLPAIIQGAETLTPLILFMTQGMSNQTAVFGAFFDLITGNSSIDEISTQLQNLTGPLGAVFSSAQQMGFGFGFAIGTMIADAQRLAGDVSTNVNNAVGFIQSIPERAQAALADAGSRLTSSGRALIQGFIDGIDQMFAPVRNAVTGILDYVAGFFPNSPAKRGPFSGAGWTKLGRSGSAIAEQFQSGLSSASLTVPIGMSSSASFGTVTSSAGALPPVYVQNPFTGEYLLAQVGTVADQRVATNDRGMSRVVRGRVQTI